MRRILAIVLLIAFGSPLVLPALASTPDPQKNLPACCRRNGAHHCTGMVAPGAQGAPAFAAPPCAGYPSPSTPLRLNAAVFAPLTAAPVAHLHTAAPLPANQSRARFFTHAANPTRGPPTPLA